MNINIKNEYNDKMHAWIVLLVFSLTMLVVLRILCNLRMFKQVWYAKKCYKDYKNKRKDWLENEVPKWERPEKASSYKRLPKIIFAGLAKDIRDPLQANLEYLLDICKNHCEDYRIIIVENDSTDGTKEYIQTQAELNPNIILLSSNEGIRSAVSHGGLSTKRFEIMAYWRNKYIEELKNDKYKDFDYVCVTDLDHHVGTTEKALKTCFEHKHWDAISANGISTNYTTFEMDIAFFLTNDFYYDRLAYRDAAYKRVKRHSPVDAKNATLDFPYFDVNDPDLKPVTSGFGGITIYRKEALLSATYSGHDCEHICLHDKMIQNGYNRMFVNPKFVLWH
jgi:glycosyltransferase involved in cell wall biosynthesis